MISNFLHRTFGLAMISLVVLVPSFVLADTLAEYPITTASAGASFITSGSDGRLWFTENSIDKIAAVTTAGVIVEYDLPTSVDPIGPLGITPGPDNRIWFTENLSDKIGAITTDGVVTEYPLSDGAAPYHITQGPDGNLWFTENGGNKIGKITVDGTITEYPLPTSSSAPRGIVAGPDGKLWFTEFGNNKIGRITTGGTIREFSITTASSGASEVTVGSDGNIWFSETTANKIGKLEIATGTITEYTVTTGSSAPRGIVAGPAGTPIWFVESAGNQIGKIAPDGTIIGETAVTTGSSSPLGITLGPDDHLWFVESANAANNVAELTPSDILTVSTTSPLSDATQYSAYSNTINASGGTTPYTWSAGSPGLNSDLTLSSGGVLTGTPLSVGTSNFQTIVTDAHLIKARKTFSLTVLAADAPDLVAAWSKVRLKGNRATATLTIRNTGTESAPSSTAKIYLSPDGNFGNTSRLLSSQSVAAIAEGGTATQVKVVTTRKKLLRKWFLVNLDTENDVSEIFEGNNRALARIR